MFTGQFKQEQVASPEPDPSPRPSPQPETAAEVHRVGERVAEPGEGDRLMFAGQFKKEQVVSPEPGPHARRVLVLGLGNDILCDDAVGLRVVRQVQAQLRQEEPIDVQETEEMGLSLLDFISGYRDLLLVDSIQRGSVAPGSVHEICADDLTALPGSSPHFLGVGETIALGRQLGLPMPTRVRIFAIEVEQPHRLSTEMTAPLQRALPDLVRRVLATARELAQGS